MKEERGQLAGDFTIAEPFTLWGSIAGTVTAVEGSKLYMRGAIYGNLVVENGGRVHVFGNVSGDVIVKEGAKVIIGGAIGGNAVNHGGRLYVEGCASVAGRVKYTYGVGETKIEPGAKASKE